MKKKTIISSYNLSQAQLACITGVSKGTIYYAEKEGRALPLEALKKLSRLEIGSNDPDKIEAAIRPLRKIELTYIDILMKKQKVQILKLERIITNKEAALAKAKRSFAKRLQGLQTSYLAIEMCEQDNAPKEKIDLLKMWHAQATATFHAQGPAKQVALIFEIKRLKLEMALVGKQMEKLRSTIQAIKDANVSEWIRLLG